MYPSMYIQKKKKTQIKKTKIDRENVYMGT